MKYKKISIMNSCSNLAKSLQVKYRASELGISIFDKYNKSWKFFSLDELYLTKGINCKKHIKEVAKPSLQTILK